MVNDKTILINVQATDNASSVIAGASTKIAESFRNVEVAQNGLSIAVNASIAPLSEAERAQMASADSSLKLRDAQIQVRSKQDELNTVIKQYGANSTEAASKLRELNSSQSELAKIQPQVSEGIKQQNINYKDLVVGVSGVATASFSLYNAYDAVGDAAVGVSKANLAVKTTADSVEGAQKRYNDTVSKYGPVSAEAVASSKDLQLAEERHAVAVERADMVQGNYSETIARSALSVIPTMITMVSSLSAVKGILTGATTAGSIAEGASAAVKTASIAPTGALTAATWSLNTALLANPVVLIVAGIVALVAAIILAYNYCKPFKDAVDSVGKALGEALKPAIDLVMGALTWLWNNVLKPLAEFLYGGFLAAIKVVGDAIGWLANAVGGAWNWIVESVAKATGTWNGIVIKGMDDQLKTLKEGTDKQIELVKKATQQQILDETAAYDTRTKEAQKFWNDFINPPKDAWDEIANSLNKKYDDQISNLNDWSSTELDAINEHYNSLISDVNKSYDKQIGDVNKFYDDLTSSMETEYKTQLNATTQYYDDLLSETTIGLKNIRASRDADMDAMELAMLQEKEALEVSFKSGLIDKEKYEASVSAVEATYRDKRSALSDDYRLAELLEEKAHAGQAEAITTEKNAAILNLETSNNTNLASVNEERNTKVSALTTAQNLEVDKLNKDRQLATVTIEQEVNNMMEYLQKERTTMVSKMRVEEQNIEAEHNRRVAELMTQGQEEQLEILRAAEAQKQQIIAGSLAKVTGTSAPQAATASTIAASIGANKYSGPQLLANDIMAQSGRNYSKALQVADVLGQSEGWSASNIAALKVLIPKMALGGIVNSPTLALIGEAGPERVTPLNRFNSEEASTKNQTMVFSPNIYLTVEPGAVQNPRQMARELLDEMNSLIRNDMKSKTFFTQG